MVLIVGCTRVYECDVEIRRADGEYQLVQATENASHYRTQVDFWEDGYSQDDAEELCDERFKDGSWSHDEEEHHCTCKRAN